ncbi:hypothetical protein SRB5_43530 [Streptomyces sp. RB5]|uniref:DUF397 domain-containing protein n=1 Tax=Streptomyces smaragdinus TaxID=2585196 RepID=A0A7K0CL98_9ACTN|nr:DUF397 domain-containing protein [Streptomyces smaragdinus]MQY14191.1 hypothetical protein [Streptomyces smaragdinus]
MSTTPDPTHAVWIKSSHSGNGGGNCVEWAPSYAASGVIPVRDSKDPSGPTLAFTPTAWTSFVEAIRHGDFGTV